MNPAVQQFLEVAIPVFTLASGWWLRGLDGAKKEGALDGQVAAQLAAHAEAASRERSAMLGLTEKVAELSRLVGSLATEVHGFNGDNGLKGNIRELREELREMRSICRDNCQLGGPRPLRTLEAPPPGSPKRRRGD